MEITVPDKAALRKRILRFFDSKSCRRGQVNGVVERLSQIGEVALFGGMIRDLCLETNRTFYSDVDIVINTLNETKLAEVIAGYKHTKNAYGGYRIFLDKWSLDVWNLPTTWAFQNHFVACEGFHSLIHTTFFSWDAIVFELESGKFHFKPSYFQELNHRVLDINLQANPNVLGTVVRTWRFLELREARLSQRLAAYLQEHTREFGIEKVLAYETKSYHPCCLSMAKLQKNYSCLVEFLDTNNDDLFELTRELQTPLFS